MKNDEKVIKPLKDITFGEAMSICDAHGQTCDGCPFFKKRVYSNSEFKCVVGMDSIDIWSMDNEFEFDASDALPSKGAAKRIFQKQDSLDKTLAKLLTILSKQNALTRGEVAKRMGMKAAALTDMFCDHENYWEYVYLAFPDHDRRKSYYSLNRKGIEMLSRMKENREQYKTIKE